MPVRALGLLVAGLGACVVIAFVIVIAAVLTRKPAPEIASPRSLLSPPLEADGRTAWGRVALDQPAGTRIQSVTASGAFIVLQLYTASLGQDERLVVLDPASGRLVGTFAIGAK